jgi:uncharacterized membrane protein
MKPRRVTYSYFLIALLLVSIGIMLIPDIVSAQTEAHLTVTEISGQNLTAGFNNTASFTVLNNYYGYTAIYDVGITVSPASSTFPLALYGDNNWHYDSIPLGGSVTINMTIYAPVSAIGSTYQGTVTITYKQLGDISYTQEAHSLSFAVYGWINLMLYGILLTPSLTTPGGNLTISGNILNSGNLASYNATVTVTSDVLAPGTSNSAFIGEVDPNIPRPFSLQVFFKPNVEPSNYSLTVKVYAIDQSRPGNPISASQDVNVQIQRATTRVETQPSGETGIILEILSFLRSLYTAFFGSRFSTASQIGTAVYSYLASATTFLGEARPNWTCLFVL